MGDNYAAHKQTDGAKCVYKTQNIAVIGYAEVASYLVVFNIARVYNYNYLDIGADIFEHTQLAVRLKARQNP